MEKKLVPLIAMFAAGFVIAVLLRDAPSAPAEVPLPAPPNVPLEVRASSADDGDYAALKAKYDVLAAEHEELRRATMRKGVSAPPPRQQEDDRPRKRQPKTGAESVAADPEFFAEVEDATKRFVPNMPYRAYRPYRAFKVYEKGVERSGTKKDCSTHRHAAECWGTYVHCERDPDNPECEGTSFYCNRFPEAKTCIGTEAFCLKNRNSRFCSGTQIWCQTNRRDPSCAGSSDVCTEDPNEAACFGTSQFCDSIGGPPCPND